MIDMEGKQLDESFTTNKRSLWMKILKELVSTIVAIFLVFGIVFLFVRQLGDQRIKNSSSVETNKTEEILSIEDQGGEVDENKYLQYDNTLTDLILSFDESNSNNLGLLNLLEHLNESFRKNDSEKVDKILVEIVEYIRDNDVILTDKQETELSNLIQILPNSEIDQLLISN